MSDAPASPKKTAKAKAKTTKPKTPAAHPPVLQMVTAAIKSLKERKGSSLSAIKKYIEANYKVDMVKLAPFVKKCIKTGVTNGKFVQTKGTGATGSFKLPAKEKVEKPKTTKKTTKPKTKKPAGEKKAKKPKTKKSPKKPAAKKAAKKPAAKKATKPKKAAKKPAAKKATKPKKAAKKPAAKKATKTKKTAKPKKK